MKILTNKSEKKNQPKYNYRTWQVQPIHDFRVSVGFHAKKIINTKNSKNEKDIDESEFLKSMKLEDIHYFKLMSN